MNVNWVRVLRGVLVGALLALAVFAVVGCEEVPPITGEVVDFEYDDYDDTSGFEYVYDYWEGDYVFKYVESHDPPHWHVKVLDADDKTYWREVSEYWFETCEVGDHYAVGQCE